ncbi:exonuclease SbcCD subunit D [Candidatus Woesearchaeota archaeon]|nr:exonuclease SbcCD subunit D [Candidatus Woesearchaeota archaeon]
MKFAHFSDVHIGSWRDPKLHNTSTEVFAKAVDFCMAQQVDFVLIAGDLFNTSLPPIDKLKAVVTKLKELQTRDIPIYVTAGSHDYSPSGKTMLEVLEEAGLLINVVKGEVQDNKLKLNFTIDKKTGVKITGMIGKKGMLERSYYEALDTTNLENEPGYKIFMFHTAISELKPKELEMMDSTPISLLPKGFNYYAGGHVHIIKQEQLPGYGTITYPGALFPANFKELEQFHHGGLYLVDDNKIAWHPIALHKVRTIKLDCNQKTPQEVEQALFEEIGNHDYANTIITIRLFGCLRQGRVSDINFQEITQRLYDRNAHVVLKNTNALTTKEFEAINADAKSTEDIELKLVKEHLGQIPIQDMTPEKEEMLIISLMKTLSMEKDEGERNLDFENRLRAEVEQILTNEKLI